MTVGNGLSGWRILPKTSAKIGFNRCNCFILRVMLQKAFSSLVAAIFTVTASWRQTGESFYGGWYENKRSETFFLCCMQHLSAFTFFAHKEFKQTIHYFMTMNREYVIVQFISDMDSINEIKFYFSCSQNCVDLHL
jgi:hypothetical protein